MTSSELKRLAELRLFGVNSAAILSLLAENERLKERKRHLDMVGREQAVRVMQEATRAKLAEDQRDEAVALLREVTFASELDPCRDRSEAFLSRIKPEETPTLPQKTDDEIGYEEYKKDQAT